MWDYIIVGAGSAGCVLANRLSADQTRHVLLIEAGGSDWSPKFRVPLLGSVMGIGNPSTDWCFKTEPDPTRNGRLDVWPRGKVLGGSSSINGMLYVRGNRGDYDAWAQSGLSGWSYDDLLPYFRRMEDDRDQCGVYGDGGPLPISRTRGVPEIAHKFLKGMGEIGIPLNTQYNGEDQIGSSVADTTQRAGLRYSSARAYLHPARRRPNLHILTGATVRRIVFRGVCAEGVEIEQHGQIRTEKARAEVIICAGAVNSPKLLLLSGIGDAESLRKLTIPIVHNAPSVGHNLHEHPNINVQAHLKIPTLNSKMGLPAIARVVSRFVFKREGPLTHVLPAIAFGKSDKALDDADLQFHFLAFGFELGDAGVVMLDKPAATIQANVNRTRSRGWLELRSADPGDPPRIFPNLLADPYDMATLVAGGRMARAVFKSRAFAPFVESERCPGDSVQTEQEWEAYIRSNAGVEFHPCGTCRMGSDLDSVVDGNLRVRGTQQLRVADASVIPQIPSANINAITMVIGEKAADLITHSNRVLTNDDRRGVSGL